MTIMTASYSKQDGGLFQESAYYAPLQELLNQLVSDHQASLGQSDLPYRILDAGSGEGSHLAWLLDGEF